MPTYLIGFKTRSNRVNVEPYSNLDSPGYNLDWPTAVAGEADSVSSVSASACHIGGPNSLLNPGQILLVYGTALTQKSG